MRYYERTEGGYLLSIGTGSTEGTEITQQEYERIESVIRSAPEAPEGYAYRLTASLEWELVEIETPDINEILTETEEKARAFDILTGVNE